MLSKRRSGTRFAANLTSKPREPIVFFLDESLDSETVVNALRGAGAIVERSIEHFPRGTEDQTWLGVAGRNMWVVLTRDKRIRYRPLERLALQSASVRAFVFTGGNVTVTETAQILVAALPRIERLARKFTGPCLFHIGKAGEPVRMDQN